MSKPTGKEKAKVSFTLNQPVLCIQKVFTATEYPDLGSPRLQKQPQGFTDQGNESQVLNVHLTLKKSCQEEKDTIKPFLAYQYAQKGIQLARIQISDQLFDIDNSLPERKKSSPNILRDIEIENLKFRIGKKGNTCHNINND